MIPLTVEPAIATHGATGCPRIWLLLLLLLMMMMMMNMWQLMQADARGQ